MKTNRFTNPVYVAEGPSLIREIASVEDAIDFLEDWPKSMQGPVHNTALKACYRAASGLLPVDGARDAMESFARISRILEDGTTMEPWKIAPKVGAGGGGAAL